MAHFVIKVKLSKKNVNIFNSFLNYNGGVIMHKKQGRYDPFRQYLFEKNDYAGYFEIPKLNAYYDIPNSLIPFSKAQHTNNYNQWVVFYQEDEKFTSVWNNPRKYLSLFKKFNGVISPDYSLYRNMPLSLQIYSTMQGRLLARWWQTEGINVIPNIRFSDFRSYDFCFDGIEKNSTVAVSTLGCIKKKEDRMHFDEGIAEMVHILNPKNIVVYGAAPDDIFGFYRREGIEIVQFESDISNVFEGVYS